MSLQQFMNEALSPWMKQDGPDSDIVLSSRIRLARNFSSSPFPLIASDETLEKVLDFFKEEYKGQSFRDYKGFEVVQMNDLEPVEKRVLVEKHLISPHLAEKPKHSAALISENEQVSIMINEEDHIRL